MQIPHISNIKKSATERDASFDLLRIIAMILVMVTHVDFMGFYGEVGGEIAFSNLQVFSYAMMKCSSIICVDLFVLISGWFGLRPTLHKLAKLLFQIWFFAIIIEVYFLVFDNSQSMSFSRVVDVFSFYGYWFVPAYLLLYVCSPILNSFVENSSQKTFLTVLAGYYTFQFIFGWIFQITYFNKGFSPLSFFSLYLTARYIKIYGIKYLEKYKLSRLVWLYIMILIVTTIIFLPYTFYMMHLWFLIIILNQCVDIFSWNIMVSGRCYI